MSASTLQQLIEAELEAAQQLLEILKQEYEALQQPTPDDLEQVIVKKLEQLKRMAEQSESRNAFFSKQSFGATPESIEQYIGDQGSETRKAWADLCETAQQLEQQNLANGGLISLGQQRTQIALNIITANSNENKTYGKEGYTEQDSSHFTSVKA